MTTTHWVGTWSAAQQLTESTNRPPAPGLSANTLRQIVCVSLGGKRLRVRFSNEYGDAPVVLHAVRVAASIGESKIDPRSDTALTFDREPSAIVPAGADLLSDPLDFSLRPLAKVAVTIAFGKTPEPLTGHPGSRTTSYLQIGEAVRSESLPAALTTEHWYFLAGIDVLTDPSTAAVVTFGDSITDGRGSTTDGCDRWPDALARRLRDNPATSAIAVLNQGIGGNAVLGGGLGPPGRHRFQRDVIERSGVGWVVVLAGVNDIGSSHDPTVVDDLVDAYRGFIELAHRHHIRAYGAPILPFGGSQYDSALHEAARQGLNRWIRTSGAFDAVIDFDAAVRDPERPSCLRADYDTGDHLHLNAAGYRAMAAAIDLTLFSR